MLRMFAKRITPLPNGGYAYEVHDEDGLVCTGGSESATEQKANEQATKMIALLDSKAVRS